MKKTIKLLLVTIASIIFLIPFTYSTHAETNNKKSLHKNSATSQPKKYKRSVRRSRAEILVILDVMPDSGKAREAGFDESYIMETSTILDSNFALCAKASRGLIMLDNAMLKKCGGRAKGWPIAPRAKKRR